MSSDFFGNLQGSIRFPDAQINQGGPLPGEPYEGPDGKYNFNNELLSGITDYAGPKTGRMGSDRNYQQIPHRIQQVVPMLYLPKADKRLGNDQISVSHPVDQGDLAFVINTGNVNNIIRHSTLRDAPVVQQPGRSAFCNLPTLNYILAGLQRLSATDPKDKKSSWGVLAHDLGYNFTCTDPIKQRQELLKLISTRLMPYGICAGSENQGGQHETGLSPVQAACNFVITMTVDGQNRDLVNFWRGTHISAGDQLILRLEYVPTRRFILNHYFKEMVHESFPTEEYCWLLVPDKFSMVHDPKKSLNQKMKAASCPYWPEYDYRLDGYWRIGQTFQHRGSHDEETENFCNDMCFMRGQLLQVTFAPVWLTFSSKKRRQGQPQVGNKRPGPDMQSTTTIPQQQCVPMSSRPRFQTWSMPAVPRRVAAPLVSAPAPARPSVPSLPQAISTMMPLIPESVAPTTAPAPAPATATPAPAPVTPAAPAPVTDKAPAAPAPTKPSKSIKVKKGDKPSAVKRNIVESDKDSL